MSSDDLCDSAPPSAEDTGRPRTWFGSAGLTTALCFIGANLGIALLIRLFTIPTAMAIQWWAQVVLAIGVLSVCSFICIHLKLHWINPTARAESVLRQIRAGEAPIEDLAAVTGGVAPLLRQVQDVLRDLRRQKAEIARIERETSQRVASRTDALERSLGAVRQQAAKDALTGLYNRRTLDTMLPEQLERCRTEGAALTILMIDVDDFKMLNDTLGHSAGDDFLRTVGQLFRSTLRECDVAFRYGGDEFLILLPNSTRAQGESTSHRLTSLVDGLTKTLPVPRPPRLSIGVLHSGDLPTNVGPELLIGEADRLLYDVKLERKAGRLKKRAG